MLATAFLTLAGMLIQSDIPGKYLAPAPKPDQVVARVDGVDIKASDVNDLLWQWRGQEAVADLISYQVIKNAAVKEKVSVPDAEVQKMLDDQVARITPQVTGGKPVDQYLLEQGFTRSRMWIRIKTELLLNQIAAKDFKPADYVKISTIVVRPESTSTKALTDGIRKAELFYDMLKKGDEWEKVLNLSTTDARIMESKGLVGWRRMDAFPETVQAEFKTLAAKGVTKPVQTASGIQIFRVEMYGKDAKNADLSEAELTHISATKNTIANKIRSEAKVEKISQN